MPGKVFFYEDDDGTKRDVEYLDEFQNDDAEINVMLRVILDFIDLGNSLDDGLELFGTAELQAYHAENRLTRVDLEAAIAELSDSTELV